LTTRPGARAQVVPARRGRERHDGPHRSGPPGGFVGPEEIPSKKRAPGDPLTGLPLRHGFLEAIASRPERSGTAIFCVDIDGMRALNDSEGRRTGDAVIAATGAAIADALDDPSIAARDGADSFAFFVPELTRDAAAAVAEDVSSRASSAASTVAGSLVTLSVGVALWTEDPAGPAGLLGAARRAARSAREAGSGRTVFAADVPPLEGPDLVLDGLPCPVVVGRDR